MFDSRAPVHLLYMSRREMGRVQYRGDRGRADLPYAGHEFCDPPKLRTGCVHGVLLAPL